MNYRPIQKAKPRQRVIPYGLPIYNSDMDKEAGISLTNLTAYFPFNGDVSPVRSKYSLGWVLNISSATWQLPGKIDYSATPGATVSFRQGTTPDTGRIGNIDFTWFGWVWLNSKAANQYILRSGSNTLASNIVHYALFYDVASDRFIWRIGDNTTAGNHTSISANNFGSPSVNTFYFFLVEHIKDGNITISINNGTPNSILPSFRPLSGFQGGTEIAGVFIDGLNSDIRVCDFGMYKRLLTSLEKKLIYNNGNGYRL